MQFTLYIRRTFSMYLMRNITESHIVSAAKKQAITCHIVECLNEQKKIQSKELVSWIGQEEQSIQVRLIQLFYNCMWPFTASDSPKSMLFKNIQYWKQILWNVRCSIIDPGYCHWYHSRNCIANLKSRLLSDYLI